MYAKRYSQTKTRGTIFALLLSAAIHLAVPLVFDLHSRIQRNGVHARLNVSFAPPVSELPPIQEDKGIATQSPESYFPETETSRFLGARPYHRVTNLIDLDTQPGIGTASYYFLNSEVDIPAEPLTLPSIVLPEQAFISKLSGKVRARVFIDPEGRVDFVVILESRPPYPPFEEIAINALKETRYLPAEISGQTVGSQKTVEVVFNPYEDSANEAETQSPFASGN